MKPETRPTKLVPLTDDDRDMLLSVYETRLRFLFVVYVILFAKITILSFYGLVFDPHPAVFSWLLTALFRSWLVDGVLFSSGLYFLFTRVLPFKYDARSGEKEQVSYTIERKEYFPITNQYYVAIDDPEYLHHEIDEDTYNNCSEGDTIFLYRGARSKYIFEQNGRFSII